MKRILLPVLIAGLLLACNPKEQAKTTTPSPLPKYDLDTDTSVYSDEMKRYWLILLKKGDNRTQDSASAAKIQEGHMTNINRLVKAGKIIMAGPIGVEGDLRGIFIMNAADSTEVAALVNTDTAVITGRLKMEYYPWWSAKGKFIFK